MFRNESGDIRHRRNEKFLNNAGRFLPGISTNRPPQYYSRGGWRNRFPQQNFRPFRRLPLLQGPGPQCSPMNMNNNYQSPMNYHQPFIPQYPERCPFPGNFDSNFHCNEYLLPNARIPEESGNKFSNYGLSDTSTYGAPQEIWIEAVSPEGQMYYYNSDTRATMWEKPKNVQIMTLQQIEALNSQEQDIGFVNKENNLTYLNSLLPMQTTVPPGLILFPPNLCSPPPYFVPQSSSISNLNIPQLPLNVTIPSVSFPISEVNSVSQLVAETSITTSAVNVRNNQKETIFNSTPNISKNPEQKIIFSKEVSSSVTQTSKEDKRKSNNQIPTECATTSGGCSTNKNLSQNAKYIQDSNKEIKQEPSETNLEENKLKRTILADLPDTRKERANEVDKSRPVSSTPVSGSRWCVVWTGDGKVFFFDFYRKISVWEIPEELAHRADVKRLIKSPPTTTGKDQENSSSHSSVKKLKLESEDNTIVVQDIKDLDEGVKPTIQEIILKATKEREDIPRETRVQMFMEMLSEKNVSAFSTWEKELHKIVFDSRYLLLTPRERKHKFEKYVNAKVEEEKILKKKELSSIKDKYMLLLQETGVTMNTRFSDFAHRHAKDSRFQAVERIKDKEKYFNEFLLNLRRTVTSSSTHEKQASKFQELLKEQAYVRADSSWSAIKKDISRDERYLAIQCEEKREKMFRDFIRNSFSGVSLSSRGKEERINASIQTRRNEVERNLNACMKELAEEKLIYKRGNLHRNFSALLTDLVKNPDIKFREAMNILKTDCRWEGVSGLKIPEREKLFESHIHLLKTKKKVMFHKVLDEILREIDLTSVWIDVKKTIRADQRCANHFRDEKKCEREFNSYMKERLRTAKEDYRKLLKETKIITHASKELIKRSNHLESIESALAKDKRHLVLKCIEHDRKKILMSYIDDLHRKGAPPPPTASEPFRR